MTTATETLPFRTELKQLLHLITHSLYSNKEIFLRELISNASDAVNKIKFDSLSHEEKLEGDKDWKIKVSLDKAAGTLTVSDNGVGMGRESIVENLGTIARSGTRAYLDALKAQQAAQRPDLIGQFGVGFYSAFMVADKVTVYSRPAGSPSDGVKWQSDGQGEFLVEDHPKARRGTDVVLHLKDTERDFLDAHRLRQIIRKFSDFIEHPVALDVERTADGKTEVVEEVVNSRKAVWLRHKSENTAEEYDAFYRQISSDYQPPAKVVHYGVEGSHEFKALLYVPSHKPLDMTYGDHEWGLRLYVQRVLIMDHCEKLLPVYLRFVKGVVDSADLPLNISREMLQENPLLDQIRKNVTKAVLRGLEEMKSEEYDKYVTFFGELGAILKEGPGRDYENRERLADLFLYESMDAPAGTYTTLAKYVEGMKGDQKSILYLTGETREQIAHSPYLESCRAKGHDVLLLTDPVDDFAIQALRTYKDKPFEAVDRVASADGVAAADTEKFAKLLERLKAELPEVAEVRLSSRLQQSASCLVAAEGAPSAHVERLLERWGKSEAMGASKRVLELNGAHPAVAALLRVYEKDAADARLGDYARLLYDQAVVAEGSRVKDPAALARRINDLLLRDAGA